LNRPRPSSLPGRRVLRSRLALATLIGCSALACADLRDPPALTIGGEAFTLKDLRREYADLDFALRPPLGSRESRREFVDKLVERRLLAEFGDSLVTARGGNAADFEPEESGILIRRLQALVGGSDAPPEELVDEGIEKLGFTSRIERLVFPDRESAARAATRLSAGETFEDLIRDGAAVPLEGEEWVQWTPVPNVLPDVAASLSVGDVSEPFRIGVVDQILRVVDRAPRFEDPTAELRSRVSQGFRVRAQAERVEGLAQQLRTDAGFRILDDVIELLSRRTEESILRQPLTEHDAGWALPALGPDEEAVAVARWNGGGALTALDYVESVRRLLPVQRPGGAYLARQIRRLIRLEGTSRLMLAEAKRRGLARDWWSARALRRSREGLRIRVAVDHVESEVRVDSAEVDSLGSLLQSVRPSIHRREPRARILRFDLPSRGTALEELRRIRESDAGTRLVEILHGDPFFTGTFQITYLSPGGVSDPEIETAVFGTEGGTVTGPFELTGHWSLLVRLDLEPARELTEEEIRRDLEARIRRDRMMGAVPRWLERRREDRGVTIDEGLLDALGPGI
jgi:hypothetical protein